MRKLLLLSIILSGCSISLEDKRIDPAKIEQILNQQGAVINAIVEQVRVLQERGYLDKPKQDGGAK